MTLKKGYMAFCDFAKNKSFSLIGVGVSNLPLVSFLYNAGTKSVVVRDLKKTQEDQQIKEAVSSGAKTVLGDDYLAKLEEDVIIRSPGIRPDIPAFLEAKDRGSELYCETDLFFRFCPCQSFAVTGSDGKTTTTTLIAKILEEEGYLVHLGGNIGKAMLPQLKEIDENGGVSVTELSSFQLMQAKYSPDVCVITNLSENHLDWHRDMDEYLEAKTNIYKNQTPEGKVVLNLDNNYTAKISPEQNRVYFSYEKTSVDGDFPLVFVKDGVIFKKEFDVMTKVLNTADILLPGKHNVENFMAAIAATSGFVSEKSIKNVAQTFGGVEHRIELVRRFEQVTYYNSSIDSSPARSTAALRAFQQKVIMIAGGYDKNLDYTALGDEICQRVKVLILCGATAEKIKKAVEASCHFKNSGIQIYSCERFEDTVPLARKFASAGDQVILSPASASFDLFRNFEERGKYFKKLVMELS